MGLDGGLNVKERQQYIVLMIPGSGAGSLGSYSGSVSHQIGNFGQVTSDK